MVPVNSLNIDNYIERLNIKTIKTNKGITYLNIEAGLDFETTSIGTDADKFAFMYIWMLGIGFDNKAIYGRTWEELADFLNELIERLELAEDYRLVIYIHNMGYEFQFMRHYFEWSEVFAIAERKPIRALLNGGIELRDSYILSGFSLANTARNLTKYKVEKLTGDLDYSLTRHYQTPLTVDELGYCENDIKVILAYIKEEIEHYKDIGKIPMTNTGRVRKFVRDACYQSDKSHKKSSQGKYHRYRKIMLDLTLDKHTYYTSKVAFMGGFTHASNSHVGKVIESVDSIDLTSSYPSVMVAEYFPMSRAKKLEIKSMDHYRKLCADYCLIMTVKLEGVTNKLGYESYLSESRCTSVKGATIDNGRVFAADEIITTITEVDFEIVERVYQWEKMSVTNVIGFRKGRLPKSIVQSILNLYEKKTTLKDVEGYETEYLLSKGMLNSIYGMSVTDVLQNNIEYADGWRELPTDVEEAIGDYNASKNRFLYYPWGVWVTAYARRNLWTAIIATGNDYIYSDTDSVKMLNYADHKPYVERYNAEITRTLEQACKDHGIDPAMLAPKNSKGQSKPLGIWEHEGHFSHFKTLGAKRYMYREKGQFNLVVAGLSKQNGMRYIESISNSVDEVFDSFNNKLFIPALETGKMTHTYIDDEMVQVVKDYKGQQAVVHSKSSIHLEPCEFTLSISDQYAKFIKMLSQGFIFSGVKHI